ncbi:MAG TPA: LytTR family DNA-binding domain-containing protein [Steroidobacteraceae bacterium]|nr:LytTR family DNA-binding domain-containing protein [Steroidobacteraceae bacterium]
MLEVIIVDDEPAGRRTLRECCARECDIRVIGEYGDGRAALEAIRARPPHVLFLDVQMGSLDGISLARSLDARNVPLIVFVTAYDQHALEAFELSAVDYLLKPFDDDRFRRMLERVRRRREVEVAAQRQEVLDGILARIERAATVADPRARVLAEIGSRMHMLDVTQIELAESDRNYVKLTVGRDTFHARSTLQQAERTLQSQPMLRISRSCLVNMNHVREVSRTPRGDFILVLTGGATVTSSEGFRDTVRQRLERLKVHSG